MHAWSKEQLEEMDEAFKAAFMRELNGDHNDPATRSYD
jgi:hypothetical protein